MQISKTDIIAKIRRAIDDIVPTATDSFTNDTDAELWQATSQAVQALLEELPLAGDLGDPEVVDRYLPWSDLVPASVRIPQGS